MDRNQSDTLFWGLIVLALGILFLLKNLGIHFNVLATIWKFWPAVLIMLGIKNLLLYFKYRQ